MVGVRVPRRAAIPWKLERFRQLPLPGGHLTQWTLHSQADSRKRDPDHRSRQGRKFVAWHCDDTAAIARVRHPAHPRIRCQDPCEPVYRCRRAPVAQLDRVPDYGSGGWGFESSRARQSFQVLRRKRLSFFCPSRTIVGQQC